MLKKKARMGRPRLPKTAGKRHAAGLRMTKELRQALEEASARSGRSLSQEMEMLLEMAVGRREELPTMLDLEFGYHTAALLMLIGELGEYREKLERDWLNDRRKFARMRQDITLLLDIIDPAKPPLPPLSDEDGATHLLSMIFAAKPHALFEGLAREHQLRFGDTASHRICVRLLDAGVAK
jgi:hypothetical protein